jgi:hypothetical protein
VLKRLLAVVVAVGMIVGAFQVRAARQGDVAGGDPTEQPAGQALALSCARVLEPVCGELAAALAEEGITAEVTVPTVAAGGAAPGRGALLTLAPLHELTATSATGSAPAADPAAAQVLARSPIVAAVWDDRAEVLLERCGSALTWRCIGEASAAPGWADIGGQSAWGPVKPGYADPTTSEAGALVLGDLAASYFGRSDIGRQDIDGDPGFFTWFQAFTDAVPTFRPTSGTPLLAMLQFGPAQYDVVGVVEAEAVDQLARAAGRAGTLRLHALEPLATADVVVAPVGSDGDVEDMVEVIVERAPDLLARAGWRVEGRAPEGALAQVGLQGADALPQGPGLPSAGVVEALRRTWSEVTR